MALTALQKEALKQMQNGNNVFLTGNAGTGKSYVLNAFIEQVSEDKNLVVCAPSGIAALNVGGVTMHRAFHMPLTVCTGKLRRSKVIEAADIIIIDEISMCRIDMFDYVGRAIDDVNTRRFAHRAKNGKTEPIQLICVGDFYQLPPVIQDKERLVLNEYYGGDIGKGYAFQSEYWQKFDFHTISLKEIIRQDEPEFIENLNKARVGDVSCIRYFAEKSRKTKIKDAITICGTNKDADAINARALAKLPGRAQTFKSQITGEVKPSDKSAPDELALKPGARVILLANDAVNDQYRNGTIAEVLSVSKTKLELRNLQTGQIIWLAPYTWRISKYVVDPEGTISQEEIGTIKQFPVKLAYAVTIHKSQGQTYDMVNLNPRAWDDGQLYVALSRVRSMKKLHLTQPILRSYLITSKAVKDFYATFDDVADTYEEPIGFEEPTVFAAEVMDEEDFGLPFLTPEPKNTTKTKKKSEPIPEPEPDPWEPAPWDYYEDMERWQKEPVSTEETVMMEIPVKYADFVKNMLKELEKLNR